MWRHATAQLGQGAGPFGQLAFDVWGLNIIRIRFWGLVSYNYKGTIS